MLTGTVRLHDGRQWIDGNSGDFLHVPIGGVHGGHAVAVHARGAA